MMRAWRRDLVALCRSTVAKLPLWQFRVGDCDVRKTTVIPVSCGRLLWRRVIQSWAGILIALASGSQKAVAVLGRLITAFAPLLVQAGRRVGVGWWSLELALMPNGAIGLLPCTGLLHGKSLLCPACRSPVLLSLTGLCDVSPRDGLCVNRWRVAFGAIEFLSGLLLGLGRTGKYKRERGDAQ